MSYTAGENEESDPQAEHSRVEEVVARHSRVFAHGNFPRALEQAGLDCRVVDFSFFHFTPDFYRSLEQIRRVEQLSDAYHFTFGKEDVMVMYLLEVTRRAEAQPGQGKARHGT